MIYYVVLEQNNSGGHRYFTNHVSEYIILEMEAESQKGIIGEAIDKIWDTDDPSDPDIDVTGVMDNCECCGPRWSSENDNYVYDTYPIALAKVREWTKDKYEKGCDKGGGVLGKYTVLWKLDGSFEIIRFNEEDTPVIKTDMIISNTINDLTAIVSTNDVDREQ